MKNLITLLTILISLNGYSQSEKSQIDSAVVIMHQLVNEYRVKYGLDTLELSEVLNKRAQSHAKWMYDTKKFEHSVGNPENILKGAVWNSYNTYQPTKQWVIVTLDSWKSSPEHNKNILLPKYYNQIGYGFYLGHAVMVFDKKFTESSWVDSLK
jgi:uncharacterized protein YkwD